MDHPEKSKKTQMEVIYFPAVRQQNHYTLERRQVNEPSLVALVAHPWSQFTQCRVPMPGEAQTSPHCPKAVESAAEVSPGAWRGARLYRRGRGAGASTALSAPEPPARGPEDCSTLHHDQDCKSLGEGKVVICRGYGGGDLWWLVTVNRKMMIMSPIVRR